jgi:hypothetical protein
MKSVEVSDGGAGFACDGRRPKAAAYDALGLKAAAWWGVV